MTEKWCHKILENNFRNNTILPKVRPAVAVLHFSPLLVNDAAKGVAYWNQEGQISAIQVRALFRRPIQIHSSLICDVP